MTVSDRDALATGSLRTPLSLTRILRQPRWLVRDLAPMPAELRDPLVYARGVYLWRRVRQDGYTMLGCRRGRTLYRLAVAIERRRIPGAVVDCGACNGGSTAIMAAGAPSRTAWAFDSFEGLPDPREIDGQDADGWGGSCLGREENVREAFVRYARPEQLQIVKGWFEDTLASSAEVIGPIALLHADGDFYDPVKLTLEVLYDRISPGGWVVVDDYANWPGARKAVDHFRAERKIAEPLQRAEGSAYWQRA
jgi:hypothetical protein